MPGVSEAVIRPANKARLEALVQQLDDDGLAAVGEGIQEHFLPDESRED